MKRDSIPPKSSANGTRSKNAAIVLAMHGTPPKDFPKTEMTELFELRAKLRHGKSASKEITDRHERLDTKMRQWPRSEKNDPFYIGSLELGSQLNRKTGLCVIVGFNEFCDPDIDMAIDIAAATGAETVIVTTPMMTRGGEHSKSDIPAAIARGQQKHPDLPIRYAWPFPVSEVAAFMAAQLNNYLGE